MGNELLIKNGRVIDPANGIDKKCDVLIADGTIAEIGSIEKPVQTVIDAKDKLVTPGLIDAHCHPTKGAIADLFSCKFEFSAGPEEIACALSAHIARDPAAGLRPTLDFFTVYLDEAGAFPWGRERGKNDLGARPAPSWRFDCGSGQRRSKTTGPAGSFRGVRPMIESESRRNSTGSGRSSRGKAREPSSSRDASRRIWSSACAVERGRSCSTRTVAQRIS